jgi:HAMP domain-containing protein
MRRFALRSKLTLWFVLIGAVPAIGGGVYSYTVTRVEASRDATAVMRQAAAVTADRLDETLSAARAELVTAAKHLALRLPESPSGEDLDAAVLELRMHEGSGPTSFRTWTIVQAVGQLGMAMSEESSGEGAVSEANSSLADPALSAPAGEIVFGGVVSSATTNQAVLAYATPLITKAGVVAGSLRREIPLESLRRALGVPPLGGTIGVVDADGRAVLTNTSDGQVPDAWLRALAANASATRVLVGDEAILVAAQPLRVVESGRAWTVGVVVPESAIQMNAGLWRVVAVKVGLIALVTLIAVAVSGRITRPIRRLEEATRRIAQGETDLPLEVDAHNELELLAQSFHRMAYEFKRAQDRLVKTERLALIGQASLTMQHALRAPLTSMVEGAERLEQRADLPPDLREHVRPLYEGAVRMRDLIAQLDQVPDGMTDTASRTADDADARVGLA